MSTEELIISPLTYELWLVTLRPMEASSGAITADSAMFLKFLSYLITEADSY